MSIFYIQAEIEGELIQFALDSTSRVTQNLSGDSTSFPIEDGSEVSDHYVNKNNTITMSGRISDVKSVGSGFVSEPRGGGREVSDRIPTGSAVRYRKTSDFIEKIKTLKSDKIPFDLYVAEDAYTNCVFQTLTLSQDSTNGVSNGISSYKVSFTAKQIRFAQATRSVEIRDEILAPDNAFKLEKAGKAKVKELSPKEREEIDLILRRATFGFGPI